MIEPFLGCLYLIETLRSRKGLAGRHESRLTPVLSLAEKDNGKALAVGSSIGSVPASENDPCGLQQK